MHPARLDAKDAASLSQAVRSVLGEGRRGDSQTTNVVQNRRSQEPFVVSKLRVLYGDAGSGHGQNAAGAIGVCIAHEGNGSQRDHRIRSDDQWGDGAVAQLAFADENVGDVDRGIPVHITASALRASVQVRPDVENRSTVARNGELLFGDGRHGDAFFDANGFARRKAQRIEA